MNKTTKRIIIGAGIAGAGFLIWRFAIKPLMVAQRLKKFEESQQIFDDQLKNTIQNNPELQKTLKNIQNFKFK